MSIKNFLDSLTPQAIAHINSTINTSNQESYRKLKKIFNDQFIELKSFEDTSLDITSFDWNGIERDRNWWWQAHALPFLNWYSDSYDLQNEEERKKYFILCISAIDNWNLKTKNYDSPLAWHDHGTAFRSRNIANWIISCHLKNIDVITASDKINLYSLVMVHLEWLLDSNNYSKYTNHGFDQAMILLTIGIMFDTEKLEPQRAISRHRLEEEIRYAFTDEGVHIENSPGYQKFMLARLKQLKFLSPLGETVISQLAESYIEKAEDFLRAITLPNGYLPMIGDTRDGDKGLKYEQKNDIDVIDYSASGYVILRGNTVTKKAFHLIFKCTHLSNYHRHDDDLSLHLFFDNVTVLGDGGLGSHNEKDEKRKILRSNIAHNVPYVMDITPIRSVALIGGDKKPSLYVSGSKIIGESYAYGALVSREVDFSNLLKGYLYIKDELLDSKENNEANLVTNFYSPLKVIENENNLIITDSKLVSVKIESLSNGYFHKIPSFYSALYNVFKENTSYIFYNDTKQDKEKIEMKVSLELSLETIFKLNYRGFGPIEIKSIGGWLYDDFFPKNVCHHVMSLRWLLEIDSDEVVKKVLKSFISFHNNEEERKSEYYLGREADHTTSIRLNILLQYYKMYENDVFLKDMVRNEIYKNIDSCLKDTYKKKNNHGLMVDKAILSCVFKDEAILRNYEKETAFVFERLTAQIDAIFDNEGYCREHSISYQEYNLGIVLELISILKKGRDLGFNNFIDKIIVKIDCIKESSKKSLGYALKSNDEYITIGDSFETPKIAILNKAFDGTSSRESLLPYSEESGVFFNQTLGISIFRSKTLHFAINSSWHSYVHKQNDDLSVFLRVDGEDIFIDGGYSDIISRDVIDTRSEYLHSTIIPKGCLWISRGSVNLGFSQLNNPTINTSDNSIIFSGAHSRVEGLVINRNIIINENEKSIKIMDAISEKASCLHRFLVPNDHEVIVSNLSVIIKTIKGDIKIECYLNKDYIVKQGVNCIKSLVKGIKNNQSRDLIALDFISQGQNCLLINYS